MRDVLLAVQLREAFSGEKCEKVIRISDAKHQEFWHEVYAFEGYPAYLKENYCRWVTGSTN